MVRNGSGGRSSSPLALACLGLAALFAAILVVMPSAVHPADALPASGGSEAGPISGNSPATGPSGAVLSQPTGNRSITPQSAVTITLPLTAATGTPDATPTSTATFTPAPAATFTPAPTATAAPVTATLPVTPGTGTHTATPAEPVVVTATVTPAATRAPGFRLPLAGPRLLLPVVLELGPTSTLTVTNTADSGPGSLRQTIADARPGDAIAFSLTYPATITLTTGELLISRSLTIAGPGPELLAISGGGLSQVFRVDAPPGAAPVSASISGLTIRDSAKGGCALWNDGDLTLANVAVSHNAGWGMCNDNSSPTLTDMTFSQNAGGMRNDHSHPTLTAVIFRANAGSGMYNVSSHPTLKAVSFINNSAYDGGGMHNEYSRPTLTEVAFRGNTAKFQGGGMYNRYSEPRMTNVIFEGNLAAKGGGMFIDGNYHPVLTNVVFRGNYASSFGGGLYTDTGINGKATLTNVTFNGNVAGAGGGGLWSHYSHSVIQNCILWGNRAGSSGDQIRNNNGQPTISHSIVQGSGGSGAGWDGELGIDGGGNLDANPRFAEPIDPATPPTLSGDLHLLRTSPAIDAGDNSLVPAGVDSDLDGLPRVVFGAVDMGAYEFQPGLYLDKAASTRRGTAAWVMPGERVTYTLSVLNALPGTVVTGGVVSDTLPPDLQWAGPVVLDPPGAGTAGTAPPRLVTDLTISPGQAITISFPVTVNGEAPMGIITNTAAVGSNQTDAPGTASHTLFVCGRQLTVTRTADSGGGSLRQAIAHACPGGTIDFAFVSLPATITLTSGELAITRSLTITGPGADHLAVSGNGASRVFRVQRPWDPAASGLQNVSLSITGLTIRDGAGGEGDGGGLWNDAQLTLADVDFRSNSARSGGGLYNESGRDPGTAALTDVTFRENSAEWRGGGMCSLGGSVMVTDTAYHNNSAQYGGGLYNDSSSGSGHLVLKRVTFDRNRATRNGGGIDSNGGSPTLNYVTFLGNAATFLGGGMRNSESHPVMTNVSFAGNSASSGGGLHNQESHPILVNAAFGGNAATGSPSGGWGGAICNSDSNTRLTNVTIGGNVARQGGGIYNRDSDPVLQNSILWGNHGSEGGYQVHNDDSKPSFAHSDIEGSRGSGAVWDTVLGEDLGGNLDIDPRFLEPADGSTSPTTAFNLRLGWGSPAVDAGANYADPDPDRSPPDNLYDIATDLDGERRIAYGTVDMGAYELQPGFYLTKRASRSWALSGERITYTLTAANSFTDTVLTGGVISDALPAGLALAGPIDLNPAEAGTVEGTPPYLVRDLTIAPGQVVTLSLPVTVEAVTDLSSVTNIAALSSTQMPTPLLASHTLRVGTHLYLPLLRRRVGGTTLTVTTASDNGPGSLRQAIAEAHSGDTIAFALPTYPATITLTSGELPITKSLNIRGPGHELLIVSGDGRSRVFLVDRPGGSGQIAVTISGLTIRDGKANHGGGLWNDEDLVLRDVTFHRNSAYWGGGMYTEQSAVRLEGSAFRDNTATQRGGGMKIDNATVHLTAVAFSGNRVERYGGAMESEESSLNLQDVIFRDNRARFYGGGMENDGVTAVLTNVNFSGNSAGTGGGMSSYKGSLTLANVAFAGNAAVNGGGMRNFDCSLTLTNVTFGGNRATGQGGAMWNRWQQPLIQNSLLWGNRAAEGGHQVYNEGSTPIIAHSLIEGSGGSGEGWDPDLGTDLGANLDADPRFLVPVAPKQAPTTAGNLRPGYGPVVNAGDNRFLPVGLITDLDGAPRVVNGTVDLGAHEVQPGLYLVKAADLPARVSGTPWAAPGQRITYTLTVANTSAEEMVTGGALSDTLPAGVALAGAIELDPPDAGVVGSGPRILVTDLTILPQQVVTASLPVRVGIEAAPGRAIVNSAAVTSSQVITPQISSHTFVVCNPHVSVTSEADGGPGSLRQAILDACPEGTIDFSLATYPATITLTSGELLISEPLTIAGPGPELLVVSGDDHQRVFRLDRPGWDDPVPVSISGLTIAKGRATDCGGGLRNAEDLRLADVVFAGNSATKGGGLCSQGSSPALTRVIFRDNGAAECGGGMYNENGSPALVDVVFDGNWSQEGNGGGMCNDASQVPITPTLTHVTFSRNRAAEYGGGMHNGADEVWCSPSLDHVAFEENEADRDGGGIFNLRCHPALANVAFNRNEAQNDGGGLYNDESNPVLASVVLTENTAGSSGGAIYNEQSSPTLVEVTLAGNSAGWSGGGIYNDYSSPKLREVSFRDNVASGERSGGGGMFSLDSSPVMTDIAFYGNSATGASGGGGAMYQRDSSLQTVNVTFDGNQAQDGGAIYLDYYSTSSEDLLANVAFTGNWAAQRGGAIYSAAEGLTLANVTMTGNRAGGSGGGLYNQRGTPTIHNSIVWGNRASGGGDQIHTPYGAPAIAHSDIEGSGGSGAGWNAGLGTDLGGNLDADPRFVAAPIWDPENREGGDLRLRWGSPALDTGDNGLVPSGVGTDLGGGARIVHGAVDMGAYELQAGLYFAKNATLPRTAAGIPWAAPGQRITYTLQAVNALSDTVISGGIISDSLPSGLAFAGPIELSPPEAGLAGVAPPLLVRDLALGPGQAVTVSLAVTVAAGTAQEAITNRAILTATGVPTPLVATHVFVVLDSRLTVTSTADSGPGSLRRAIANAQPGQTLDFALPTNPATITLTSGELLITRSLVIAGPGPGLLAISGGGTERVFRVDRPWTAAQATGPEPEGTDATTEQRIAVAISGLTVRDGLAGVGGGLWTDEDLTLENVVLAGNKATGDEGGGGGIYNSGGNLVLSGVVLTGNAATGEESYGGGIRCTGGSLSLMGVTFLENIAQSYSGQGGGLSADGCQTALVDVTFRDNVAIWGGGLSSNTSQVSLANVIFRGNRAHGAGGIGSRASDVGLTGVLFDDNRATGGYRGNGGGLSSEASNLTLRDVTFSANRAQSDGGAIWWQDSQAALTGVTFRGNEAQHGGGMHNEESDPVLVNVAFHGNRAYLGGGAIYNDESSPVLINVTIGGNGAATGGGIHNGWRSLPTIQNSILWGNAADEGVQIYNSVSTPTITFSDIQGSGGSGEGWDASLGADLGGNLDAGPRFATAVDPNAAPTTAGNLRLGWGSPAADAGDNGLLPPEVTTDLDGVPRLANGVVDLGAYELQPGLYLIKTASQKQVAAGHPVTYTLRAANLFSATIISEALVSDALPGGLELAGAITLDPPGAGIVGPPPSLVRDLSLAPGQAVTVTLPLRVRTDAAPGVVTNTATITSPQIPAPGTASHPLLICSSHLTVRNDADAGPGSLRQALAHACPGGTVDFALTYPATVTLASGELGVRKALTITGPGPDLLALQGNGQVRVLRLERPWNPVLVARDQISVTLTGLTIRDGNLADAGQGGGLWSEVDLTLRDVIFRDNWAYGHGGGLFSIGNSLKLANVLFDGNASGWWGGGLSAGRATLTDVTFRGNSVTWGWGGGMSSGDAKLTRVTFIGNTADDYGGGLYSWDGSPVLTDVLFVGNSVRGSGGGLGIEYGGNPILTNVTFHGNRAGYGGGMYCTGYPTLTNVTFAGNSAEERGGGFYGGGTLRGVVFRNNWADSSGGGMHGRGDGTALWRVTFEGNQSHWAGGGGLSSYGDLTLVEAIFHGNRAGYGGGMYSSGGNPELRGIVFSGNEATGGWDEGGGMYSSGGSPSLANVLFSGNRADRNGGGLGNYRSSPQLTNVTFSGNWAGNAGGALSNRESNPSLQNSILWGNQAAVSDTQIYNEVSTPTLAFCDVQGSGGSDADWDPELGADLGGNLDADPRFVAPVDPGEAPIAAGDLRLQLGSPAVDAGDNTLLAPDIDTDLDGAPRIANGTVDLGAYELPPGLLLSKTASHGLAAPGERITYTLRAANNYTRTFITDAVISDALPAGLALAGPISLDPPGTAVVNPERPILIHHLNLIPGQQVTVTLPAIVEANAAAGIITNTAAISSPQVLVPRTASHALWVCGRRITVTEDSDAGPRSLRQAISDTCPGGTIEFDLNYPAAITLKGGELAIGKPLTITGPGPDLLAVRGGGAGRVFAVKRPWDVEEMPVSLSGLTIRDGDAGTGPGGGLWNDAQLSLKQVILRDNAASSGGGMYTESSDPVLADVVLVNNEATYGGGLYTFVSSPTLTAVIFAGNVADRGGGGVYSDGSNTYNLRSHPVFTDVTFQNNSADEGGGMYNNESSPVLSGVTFRGNSAEGDGGGLYNYDDSDAVLDNVVFDANSAGNDGGGIYSYGDSSLTLTGVLFRGNSAAGGGGGMYNDEDIQATLTNVAFLGNWAESGGGLYQGWYSRSTLSQVTLSGNRAEQRGGGLYSVDEALTIQNSILWANRAGTGGDQIYNARDKAAIAYSDIQGSGGSGAGWDEDLGSDGGGNLDADPLFLIPVDPLTAPTTAGDLRLGAGSAAINAGDNSLIPGGLTTDLAGWPRIYDGRVDMGAYEAHPRFPVYLPAMTKRTQP